VSTQAEQTSVRSAIVVDAPIDRSFEVFTAGIGTWFPAEYNLLEVDIAERVFEPRVGGEIYDRGTDGTECRWGSVLAYDPPDRVMFSWKLGPQWTVETDPARASEVEVWFFAEEGNRTRVELEHRHIDRHGEGWEHTRDAVAGEGGWSGCLARFAERLAAY
jgi:uncharacterized protein YndB with AHSA1/START domain